MARSKQVYAVLGLLCIDQNFRQQFFENPHAAANRLVGSLTLDELEQINRLGGIGISGDRTVFVRDVCEALEDVNNALGCPHFPCPDPEPFAA